MESFSFFDHELQTTVNDSSREAEFLRQLAGSYRDLFASAMAIVGKRDDADDVIQEVCVVLWQKYDEFEQGTNFRKWACTFAFNIAKAYARKQRRRRGVGLGDQALARVVQMRSAGSELFELRREMLRNCMDKLNEADRRFLSDCYRTPTSLGEFAQCKGRTVSSVYSKLKRLRRALTKCVQSYSEMEDE